MNGIKNLFDIIEVWKTQLEHPREYYPEKDLFRTLKHGIENHELLIFNGVVERKFNSNDFDDRRGLEKGYLQIKLSTLNAWLREKHVSVIKFPGYEEETNIESGNKPMSRQKWQEQEIIRAINERGLNPKALPKTKSGEPGIKKEVRDEVLKRYPSQWGETIFDKAWGRLRNQNRIRNLSE